MAHVVMIKPKAKVNLFMGIERNAVAREAARLLYKGIAEEYIIAKAMASVNLGVNANPSNFEVAEELDRLSDELEGDDREKRLEEMRQTARKVMNTLREFQPRLIGSVWRGTARRNSDVDLIVFSSSPREVEDKLQLYKVLERGEVTFKGGVRVYRFKLSCEFPLEVIVRRPDEYQPDRCDIYGDLKTGLTLSELERLLQVNPQRKFIPRKRTR
jgi:predicted nucleotidyltransferase